MTEKETLDLLSRVAEQQTLLLEELRAQREQLRTQQHAPKSKKDFWDQMMSMSPIISAIIIACVGSYFTYTYNQQQLKVQEIQTIEKFIPHLVGDEKSKRAAILAISSLGNDNLAARVASIFASEGTASALQSIAQKSDPKDRQVVQDALYKTLDALADKYRDGNNFEEAIHTIKKELALKEAAFGKDSPELAESLAKLGALYDSHGEHELAEMEFSRVASLKRGSNAGSDQAASSGSDEVKAPASSNDDKKTASTDNQKPAVDARKQVTSSQTTTDAKKGPPSPDPRKTATDNAQTKSDDLAVAEKSKSGKLLVDTHPPVRTPTDDGHSEN